MAKISINELGEQNCPPVVKNLLKGVRDYKLLVSEVEEIINEVEFNDDINVQTAVLYMFFKRELALLKEELFKLNSNQKNILNFTEAAAYLGLSASHTYRLTSEHKLSFFKPEGKKIYFQKKDLDAFILRNKQESVEEIEEGVSNLKIGRNA